MTTESLISILSIFASILFIFLLAKILERKLAKISERNQIKKIGREKYLQEIEDKILFEKDRKIPSLSRAISLPREAAYKPKINYFWSAWPVAFILFGLPFTYINHSEKSFLGKFFPLLVLFYGLLMMHKFFFTMYQIKEKHLVIKSGYKKHIIHYENIRKIEKHTINLYFKHGTRGRQRAETHEDTLWIFYQDAQATSRVIMISPLDRDRFFEHVLSKILIQNNS